MTTQNAIHTFQDILDVLDTQPDLRQAMLRHLLTEQLLNLPAAVAGMAETMAAMQHQLGSLTARVESLTKQMESLTARVNSLAGQMENLTTQVDSLTKEMKSLTSRVESLTKQMGKLTAQVENLTGQMENLAGQVGYLTIRTGNLEAGQARLESRVGNLEAGQARLEAGQARLESRVGNLEGDGYERRAARQAVAHAGISLGIENAELAFSQESQPQPSFNRIIYLSYRDGKLSHEQKDELLRADAIITGENGAGAVVEVSLGPNMDDAARARRRAAILQAITGGNVQAVVVAPRFPEGYAERNRVEIMEYRSKRMPA